KRAGFDLPEIATLEELRGRKLGGLRPWAWSPDASIRLKSLSEDVSTGVPWQWRELPREWFSKGIGIRLEELLGLSENELICRSVEQALAAVESLSPDAQALAKAAYSYAGRGHKR